MCDESPTLSVSDFVESRKLITMDSKSAVLHGNAQHSRIGEWKREITQFYALQSGKEN
jgi:hypothetical protein